MSAVKTVEDRTLLATPEQLTEARHVVAFAYDCRYITDDEREFFDSTLDPEAGPSLALVCRLVSDLQLLALRESNLYRIAGGFLGAAAPTRGGVFEDLDRDRDEEALHKAGGAL